MRFFGLFAVFVDDYPHVANSFLRELGVLSRFVVVLGFALARRRHFSFQLFLECFAEDLDLYPFVDVGGRVVRFIEVFLGFGFRIETFFLFFFQFGSGFLVPRFDAPFGGHSLQPGRFEQRAQRRFLQFFVFGVTGFRNRFFAALRRSQLKRVLEFGFGDIADIAGRVLDQRHAAGGNARVADPVGNCHPGEENDEGDAEDQQAQSALGQGTSSASASAPALARRPSPTLIRTHEAGSISFWTICERPASRKPSAIASTAVRRASGSSGTRTQAVFSRHPYSAPSTPSRRSLACSGTSSTPTTPSLPPPPS